MLNDIAPILRDTILLIFCWLFPIIVSIRLAIIILVRVLKKLLSPVAHKIEFLNRLLNKPPTPPKILFPVFKKKLPNIIFFTIYLLMLLVTTTMYMQHYFMSRATIISKSADDNTLYIDEKEPIYIIFDKPIDEGKLEIVTLPENVEAKTELYSPFESLLLPINNILGKDWEIPIYTGISMRPEHSIPYDTGLVFYLRGITDITNKDGVHEYALAVKTPKFPQIENTYPTNGEEDIQIDTPISVVLSDEITASFNVKVVADPEVQFNFKQVDKKRGQIIFTKPLKQGTKYEFTLIPINQHRNIESGDIKTKEEIRDGEYNLSYTTVTPAGTKKITPTGESVHPDKNITIKFTEAMNPDSIEGNIMIAPEIEYTTSWNEDFDTLTINPTERLSLETKYTIKLLKSIETEKGGTLPKDVEHDFTTFGHVKVIGFTPRDESTGNSISSKIIIIFDQEVDHASAQNHLVLSPNISVKYGWDGNKLTLTPKSSLSYSKKYTVKITKGVKSVDGYDSEKDFNRDFTTRPQTITIYVPLYNQPGYFDCNLTAASMALAGKGVSASVSSIRSYVGAVYGTNPPSYGDPNSNWINYYGVHWGPIASYIRYRGRGAEIKSGWSLSGIANEIKNGNPVIIWWYNGVTSTTYPNSWYSSVGARPGMHSVVVYGFTGSEDNPTYLYVRDPWYSYRRSYYTAGEFLAKWNYLGRRAVIVK